MDLGGLVQARRTAGVQHPDDGGWAPAPTSRHSIAWSLGTAATAMIPVARPWSRVMQLDERGSRCCWRRHRRVRRIAPPCPDLGGQRGAGSERSGKGGSRGCVGGRGRGSVGDRHRGRAGHPGNGPARRGSGRLQHQRSCGRCRACDRQAAGLCRLLPGPAAGNGPAVPLAGGRHAAPGWRTAASAPSEPNVDEPQCE